MRGQYYIMWPKVATQICTITLQVIASIYISVYREDERIYKNFRRYKVKVYLARTRIKME